MIEQVKVHTITEIKKNRISIKCVVGDQDGVDRPTILNAELLPENKRVNNVDGKEGELIITTVQDEVFSGAINEDGELELAMSQDDVNNYKINEEGDLIYE